MNDIDPPKKPSLSIIIREALDESTDPEPQSVIDSVIGRIDPFDLEFYLREAIAARLSSEISQLRGLRTPDIRRGISTKQSLIRDQYWPNFLKQRIFLPDGYKFLGEATAADLRTVAAQRQAQAQEILFRAEQFTTLAELMDKAKVKVLEQLDSAAGTKVLERAA